MAVVEIDNGGPQPIRVEIDGIENMSPADQQSAVASVNKQLAAGGSGSPAPAQSGSGANTPPAAATGPADTSYGSAVMHGLHGAAHGFGATVGLIAPETGRSIQAAVGEPAGYQPAGPDVIEGLRRGDWRQAIASLPRALAEGVPDFAGNIAAGAAGTLAGGPAGGLAGLVGFNMARGTGENAQARAANNNRPGAPTAGDIIGGGLTAGAEGALQATGLGRVPGVGAAIEGLPGIVRPVAKVGLEAAGAGAADVAQQAGDTVGTDRGLTVDPAEAGAAALQGAGLRVASLTPGAVREGTKAASDAVQSRLVSLPDDPAQRASLVRVGAAISDRQATANGRGLTPQQLAAGLRDDLAAHTAALADAVQDFVPAPVFRLVIRPALAAARDGRRDVTAPAGAEGNSPLDRVDALDIPDAQKATLLQGLLDTNTASQAATERATNGPLEAAGGLAGRASAIGAALASHNPMVGLPAAILGQPVAAQIGRGAGRFADRVFGTADTPAFVLRAMAARRMGADPGQADTLGLLRQATTDAADQATVQRQLGIQPDPGAPVPVQAPNEIGTSNLTPAQQQRGLALNERAADQVALMARRVAAARQAGTVDAMAQRQLDALTQRNAVTLAADGRTPTDAAGIPPDAQAAALTLAARRAAVVRAMAQGDGGDMLDRLTVGNPARDPVPVNTPLAADGTPLTGRPVQPTTPLPGATSAEPSQAAPSGPVAAPPVPLTASAGVGATPPVLAAGGLPSGWKAYVQKALASQGVASHVGDIHAALDTLVQADRMTPETADALRNHGGNLTGRAGLRTIGQVAAQVAANKGAGHVLDTAAGANGAAPPIAPATPGAPESTRGPIRDPARWQAAREDVQQHAQRLAGLAQGAGQPDLAATVLRIAAVRDGQAKARIAQDFLSGLPPERAELAEAVLSDATLLRGI